MSRRGRNEGSVGQKKRADGRWYGVVDYGFNEHGRRVRKYVYGRTRAEAHEALQQELDKKRSGLQPTSGRLTVEKYLVGWLERVKPKVRATTHRSYSDLIRIHVIPALGRTGLAKLSAADVERLTRSQVAKGLSPRLANMTRAVLRRALGPAVRDGLIARNVAALAEPEHEPSREATPLSFAESRALIDAVNGHPLRPLILVALFGGLRSGELCALTWRDVGLDAAELTVRSTLARVDGSWQLLPPKSKQSQRVVPVPPIVVKALRAHRAARLEHAAAMGREWIGNPWGLVFTTRTGQPVRGTNLIRTFRSMLRAAGITTPYRLHDLRASYATSLVASGVDIRTAGSLLGHSSPTLTLKTYAAAVPQLRREAAIRVSDIVLGRIDQPAAESLAVSLAVNAPSGTPSEARSTLH